MIKRMKLVFAALFIFTSAIAFCSEPAYLPQEVKDRYGLNFVKWYGQSAFEISDRAEIYIDPVDIPEGPKKADVILITHPHFDHLDIANIKNLKNEKTQIYAPGDVIAQIRESDAGIAEEQLHTIKPFDTVETQSYSFRCVPAYNLVKKYHPKANNWVGYIISVNASGQTRNLYFAGDTAKIPEMNNLKGSVDVAFLPLGQQYTMNSVEEAAAAAVATGAAIAVPIHFGKYEGTQEDAERFIGILSNTPGVTGYFIEDSSDTEDKN